MKTTTDESGARAPVSGLLTATATAMATAMAMAMVLSGCGGSGGSGSASPQNAAPMISAIPAQTIDQGTSTTALAFTVNDDGGADKLTITASSLNRAVVPTDGIVLAGSGSSRTVTVTPDESGTGPANVTIAVKDAQGLVSTITLPLNIIAVQRSVASFTAAAFAQMANDTPAPVSGITFVQDADDETTFNPLLQ